MSFIILLSSSTAFAILGPGACKNKSTLTSLTLPPITASSPAYPGTIGNVVDNLGAGAGAGLIVNIISGLLAIACSEENSA